MTTRRRSIHDSAHRDRWENLPAPCMTARDIDRSLMRRMLGRKRPNSLARLGLTRADAAGRRSFTHAAAVLCSRNPFAGLVHHELRMGRLLANGVGPFLDQRFLAGPAFNLLEAGERFCRDCFPRPEDFPMAALREALVNALIHRDYSTAVPWTTIALFDDRVEIWNPGSLASPLARLARPHRAMPKNPTIAEAFRRAGLAEGRGIGTIRMFAACKAANLAPPEFTVEGDGLMVTFRFAAP